jgi:ethanolamine utilization microcompartment shell protein EutL
VTVCESIDLGDALTLMVAPVSSIDQDIDEIFDEAAVHVVALQPVFKTAGTLLLESHDETPFSMFELRATTIAA